MIEQKFVTWLRKLATVSGRGAQAEVAKLTGLDASYISKLWNKERAGQIGLDTIQRVADHMGVRASTVVWMVEEGTTDLPPQAIHRRR